MSVIIFLIILGILIFVHELGHFSIAKWAKIRVDEFAIGFPPKLFAFTKNGTRYALNLIPFGGYVKIFGENPDEESLDPEAKNSFVNKNRWIQAAVLFAGVFFNFIFAWILISGSYMLNAPAIATSENINEIKNVQTSIISISTDGPAEKYGLQVGDVIKSLKAGDETFNADQTLNINGVKKFIADNADEKIQFTILRSGEEKTIEVIPEEGIIAGRKAVGIEMADLGEMQMGFFSSVWQGLKSTVILTGRVAEGLAVFFGKAFIGKADMDQVSGPIGLVSHVGEAARFGFSNLISFTALISLNLAIINLVPFPALDGGRLLFVAIEGITRRRIKPKVANTLNIVGFSLLMILMVVITFSDVAKLF